MFSFDVKIFVERSGIRTLKIKASNVSYIGASHYIAVWPHRIVFSLSTDVRFS